tara:strand:- start:4466 stop:5122 length:657 start_codon:yes stop_codon:yes gene_type:complete
MIENIIDLLPTYSTELPFSKQKVLFTPFKVKDAKNISIILQEDNKKLALIAMVNVLKNCTKNIVIQDLCLADAEYLFLQIRGKSIEEYITLVFNDIKKQVNINELKTRNAIHTSEIIIGTNLKIVLETPQIKDLLEIDTLNKEDIVKACIKKLIIKNEIYHTNKFVPDELKNVTENLPLSFMVKVDEFLKNQPEVYVELDFGNEKKEVSGILNFFTYR